MQNDQNNSMNGSDNSGDMGAQSSKIADLASGVASTLHLDQIGGAVSSGFSATTDGFGEVVASVERTIRRHPLVAVGGAFAIGLALTSIVGWARTSSRSLEQ